MSALDGGLDISVRLVDWNEDVVGIVLAEWAEICQQVMQVRHREVDACDLRCSGERSFPHVEQGVLHAHAVVGGEFFQESGDDPAAPVFKILLRRVVVPGDGRAGSEDAVGRGLQGGQAVFDVTGEG